MTALEEKKTENIVLLDLINISDITDYFVIGTGTSDRMLRSMQKAVADTAKQIFAINGLSDGQPENGWIVIDFGDVVVHLFGPQQREFYQLEKLWEQGKTLLVVQ